MRTACILIALWTCALQASGQGFLDRRVSLRVRRQPLAEVLDTIARRGGFSFSYNSPILPQDSLVSASYKDASVRQVLDKLLGSDYQYIQREGYIIIVRQTAPSSSRDNIYTVTGYVLDVGTGKPLANASVYEREQLQSTLTDEQGFFQLRLRGRYREPTLGVSKEWYEDTTLVLEPGKDREYRIGLRPGQITEITPLLIAATIEHSWWGRFCLSSRERIQSLNLTHFFTSKPYQVSLLPSIGTQGRMAPQVTNTVSLNVIGGYSAGTRGVEIAGVFNLDKRAVGVVQAAGLLNVAGGNVNGLQAAGLANRDLDSLTGLSAAGLANVVQRTVVGAQVAGVFNSCGDILEGVQISGLYNYAHRLKGVQVGIVNVVDSSAGYSIGLVNIVRKNGLLQVSVWEEDVTGVSVGFKSGTARLYGILMVGGDDWDVTKTYSSGAGLGTNLSLSGPWSFTSEATEQQVFSDRWKFLGEIVRLKPSLTLRISPHASLFAGPTFNLYSAASPLPLGAHLSDIPGKTWPANTWGKRTAVWAGATVGLNFF